MKYFSIVSRKWELAPKSVARGDVLGLSRFHFELRLKSPTKERARFCRTLNRGKDAVFKHFGGSMKTPILLCLLLSLAIREAQGWGAVGHKATALIAEASLTPQARQAVKELLLGQRMVDVANWADHLRDRPEYQHTIPYHFQNTRELFRGGANVSAYKENLIQLSPRERRNYRPGVVEAVAGSEEVLMDPRSTRREKQMALKFLVHFIGDLHQPLHTGLARNRGGNPIFVRWQGQDSNLHHVWDSDLIDDRIEEIRDSDSRDPAWIYAQWLLNSNWREVRKSRSLESVATWYQESLSIQNLAYDSSVQTDQVSYAEWAAPIVDHRVTMAGVRLADMLNRIFARTPVKATPNQSIIQFAEKVLGSLQDLVSLHPVM